MIIDSSALVAMVKGEADASLMHEALLGAARRDVSAPTLVETRMALTALGAYGQAALQRILDIHQIGVLAFGELHAMRAHEAHQIYGRGSGHRARLNYGDCLAYAVATVEQRPLLFKGDDFPYTDVESALPL